MKEKAMFEECMFEEALIAGDSLEFYCSPECKHKLEILGFRMGKTTAQVLEYGVLMIWALLSGIDGFEEEEDSKRAFA